MTSHERTSGDDSDNLPPSSRHELRICGYSGFTPEGGAAMRSDAYLLHNRAGIRPRPPSPQLLACRGPGTALALSCKRSRTDRGVVHPWCEHCGTNQRNHVVADECVRLLVNGPDWPEMGS